MPCQGCYRISIVLAISCGRSKTIRIRYAVLVDTNIFENGGKNLRFQKKTGYVLNIWSGLVLDQNLGLGEPQMVQNPVG